MTKEENKEYYEICKNDDYWSLNVSSGASTGLLVRESGQERFQMRVLAFDESFYCVRILPNGTLEKWKDDFQGLTEMMLKEVKHELTLEKFG